MATTFSTQQLGIADSTTALRPGPILLASDGRESTEPALRATRQLAQRFGRDVHVVGVVEPATPLLLPPEALLQPIDGMRSRTLETRRRISEQLRQDLGDRADWRAEVRHGAPAHTIAAAARDREASLVVTGLSPHPVVDRVFGNEIPIDLSRITDRPMLAVAPSWERLPRTILVTVDTSAASERVAQIACAMFPDAKTVYLVHVMPPRAAVESDVPGWEALYERELGAAFERIREALPISAIVETVTLRGRVAQEISEFAEYARVDLIVTGNHAHGMLHRLVFGNVATRLLRAATTSVLLVPQNDPARPAGAPSRTTVLRREQWSPRLQSLTQRNHGRRASLEIDEPGFGALMQVFDYPFVGLDFDSRGERVQIMLGEVGTKGRQLTHTIGSPTSIELLASVDGRDVAVRVAYDAGQALLSFLTVAHEPLWSTAR